MNKIEQKPIFKPQVACPSCGALSAIDYCRFGIDYTWWCDNTDCGKQYSFVINPDWSVVSCPTGTITTKTAVTLKVKKIDEDIFICLKGMELNGEHNDEYYYNEHTCPVNLIRGGLAVYTLIDNDPHGIFEYVKTESMEEFKKRTEEL